MNLYSLDIFLAGLLALPWLLHTGWGYLFRSDQATGLKAFPAQIFRWLNNVTDHRVEQITWLAIFWIVLRVIGRLHITSSLSPTMAWGLTGIGIVLVLFLGYPVLNVVGLFIMSVCERRAIHHDKKRYFPGHEELEAHWEEIRDEFDRFCQMMTPNRVEDVFADISIAHSETTSTTWRAVFLRIGSVDISENVAHFPILQELLNRQVVSSALFSILEPGVELVPHRGYYKGILRYHLGIHVLDPEQTLLSVNGEHYHWREGEGVIFDDMYVHTAANHSATPRVVLFLDLNRKLPEPLDSINHFMMELLRWHPVMAYLRQRAVVAISAHQPAVF